MGGVQRLVLGTAIGLWLVSGAFGQAKTPKPVAVINGEAIPRGELDAVLALRPSIVTPLTAAQQRQIHQEIIAGLVDEALFRQFLAKNAPSPDPALVAKQFETLIAGLKSQGKSLADYCKETHQTEKQVRANLTMQLQWNYYVQKKLTDAELRKYFTENKDFFDKVTVRACHIVLRMSPTTPASERAEAVKRLQALRQEIAAGKLAFADAALTHSQCESAPKGGDVGYFARKWMVEEPFAKAAFALKINEISDVVTTEYGVHLVQATDRKPGEASEFDKIKDEVRDCCSEDMRMTLIADLRKTAKIEIYIP